MTEAYFDNEQPTFHQETYGNKTRVQLCLNGEWKEIEYGFEDGEILKSKQWVCEYNEFTAPTDELPLEDIEANPSNYMDYIPASSQPKATIEKRVDTLEVTQDELCDVMAEILYGGEE